jgi:signal transduction histidine kinase
MSIRLKLGLVISVAILITTVTTSLAFLSLQYAAIRQAQEEKIALWKGTIANSASESLLGNDPLMLLDYLHNLQRFYKDFLHLRVNSGDHWQDVGKTPQAPDPSLARIETVKVSAPAGVQAPPLQVEVWFSRAVIEESQREARAKLTHNMLLAGGIVALAGMLLGFLLGWTMTSRILNIAATLRKIGAGQIEARVESQEGADELANLAQDVNIMADKLQELDGLKKTFVTSITHELRAPLNVIEQQGKALQAGAARLAPADRESLSRLMDSVGRLGHCVINLLDMANSEHGKMKYDPRPTRLTELVEDTVFYFQPKAADAKIALGLAAEPGITVCADHDMVVHVLTNLISNALKFTPPQGTIRVELKSAPQGAECSVANSGAGIPESDLAKIFDPAARGGRGVGQGLVIAKSIVDMHGGRIGVESEASRGSRFHFFLPFFAPPPAQNAPVAVVGKPLASPSPF